MYPKHLKHNVCIISRPMSFDLPHTKTHLNSAFVPVKEVVTGRTKTVILYSLAISIMNFPKYTVLYACIYKLFFIYVKTFLFFQTLNKVFTC